MKLISFAFVLSACVAATPAPSGPTPAPSGEAPPPVAEHGNGGPSCSGDAHCILPDEVLACGEDWYCHVSHTITPPSPQTKGQGQYMEIDNGTKFWTDRWFVTRPLAHDEQVTLNQAIIVFTADGEDGARRGPTSHDEAVQSSWVTDRITDTSDLFKHMVSTNDGNKANVRSIRVIVDGGTKHLEHDQQ